MPNWVEGQINIKGTPKNIINFVKKGLQNVLIQKDEPGFFVAMMDTYSLYLDESRRQFITDNIIFPYKGNSEHVVSLPYKGAWGLDTEALLKLSKKFKISFKIYGWERGCEFESYFYVKKGIVMFEDTYNYEDYNWESDFPTIGG